MDEQRRSVNRRGTVWDWPVPVMFFAFVLLLYSGSKGAPFGMLVALMAGGLALVLWLARRGSFSPRGR